MNSIKHKNYNDALEISEMKLLEEVNEVQSNLLKQVNIHLKIDRMDKAEYFAVMTDKTVKLYDLWDYNSYVTQFELAYLSKI